MAITIAEVVQLIIEQVRRAEAAEAEAGRLRGENQELKKKLEALNAKAPPLEAGNSERSASHDPGQT